MRTAQLNTRRIGAIKTEMSGKHTPRLEDENKKNALQCNGTCSSTRVCVCVCVCVWGEGNRLRFFVVVVVVVVEDLDDSDHYREIPCVW